MNCSRCQKELKGPQIVTEITRGWVGLSSDSDSELAYSVKNVLCEKCEKEVMPAFWAEANK